MVKIATVHAEEKCLSPPMWHFNYWNNYYNIYPFRLCPHFCFPPITTKLYSVKLRYRCIPVKDLDNRFWCHGSRYSSCKQCTMHAKTFIFEKTVWGKRSPLFVIIGLQLEQKNLLEPITKALHKSKMWKNVKYASNT